MEKGVKHKYGGIADVSKYGEWKKGVDEKRIRFRTVEYVDPDFHDECLDYQFEVFKRPYFFGWVGDRKWIGVIQTNDIAMGYNFCEHMLGLPETRNRPIMAMNTDNPPQDIV